MTPEMMAGAIATAGLLLLAAGWRAEVEAMKATSEREGTEGDDPALPAQDL